MTTTGRLLPDLLRPVLPRQRAAWVLAAAVVVAHTLLLGLWPRAPGPGSQAQPPRQLQAQAQVQVQVQVQVRQIQAAAGAESVAATAAPAAPRRADVQIKSSANAPVKAPSNARDGAPIEATQVASPAVLPSVMSRPMPATPAVSTILPTEPTTTAAEAPPDPGGQTLPTYRTRLPPPLTLQYAWRRGTAQGMAALDWRPEADRYLLTLKGQALGTAPLGWSSQGAFDEAGIAPQRYVESRRGREARAANFQRDRGRITFSGPAIEHPLLPGAQDRLSWLVQLAGVLAADAALSLPGSTVQLWVVGTRGDAAVWTFTVQGRPALADLPSGPLTDTVHLLREPGGPYDTQVQVWLDPARHHLPVQVQWLMRATGEGMTLALQALK